MDLITKIGKQITGKTGMFDPAVFDDPFRQVVNVFSDNSIVGEGFDISGKNKAASKKT